MSLQTTICPHDQINLFQYDDHLSQEDQTFDGLVDAFWGDRNYPSSVNNLVDDQVDPKSSPVECDRSDGFVFSDHGQVGLGSGSPETPSATVPVTAGEGGGRRKWRRERKCKNKEELESQRLNHIAVERNRRRQMNEYLGVIRSLMPASYAQRGDQASIVGGAINFIKELEQQLQSLEVQRKPKINGNSTPPSSPPQPFDYFFTSPQYSTLRASNCGGDSSTASKNRPPAVAEIEVKMVESQATIKIMWKKQHRRLLKLVAGLGCLGLVTLHLNVTPFEDMVLYTFSVRLDDRCQLKTIDDIADAVNCLLCGIEEDTLCFNF